MNKAFSNSLKGFIQIKTKLEQFFNILKTKIACN